MAYGYGVKHTFCIPIAKQYQYIKRKTIQVKSKKAQLDTINSNFNQKKMIPIKDKNNS